MSFKRNGEEDEADSLSNTASTHADPTSTPLATKLSPARSPNPMPPIPESPSLLDALYARAPPNVFPEETAVASPPKSEA